MNTLKTFSTLTFASGLAMAVGCSSAPADSSERTAAASAGVLGDETPAHQEVGFPSVLQGVAGSFTTSGVLVAPNLVLTEDRSVVKGFAYGLGTFSSGGSVCATLGEVVDLSQLRFVPGDGRANPNQSPSDAFNVGVGVKQILTDGENDNCKGGLAFLVLETPVQGNFNYPQLVLDGLPAANDPVTGCAWGRVNTHCVYPTGAPSCASGKVLLANGGYYAADQDTFPPGFILTDVPGCYNDEGGAIFDKNGALLAILDKAFQPDKTKQDTVSEACKFCDGAVIDGHLLSAQAPLVARAFAAIGSSPWRVGHPKPADVGGTCSDNLDCNSQYCVSVGKSNYCSQDCTSTACPANTVCTSVDSKNVCLPQVTPHPESCDAAPAASKTRDGAWLAVAGALGWVVALRRKRSSKSRRAR